MSENNKSLQKKGFTLIELLVVVAIISLLSSVVLASLNSARKKARDARRQMDMHTLDIAINQFYNEYGYLPRTSGSVYIPSFNDADTGGWDMSDVGGFLTWLKTSNILSNVPVDPINNSTYDYYYYCYNESGYEPGLHLSYVSEVTSNRVILNVPSGHWANSSYNCK
jgi:prepilin-type N-terminal cleavage/methylation domain-containing protein